jgi:2-succinyl-6-hydroxy-2,4-cyclohexadiene-1-carboxylate synthase
MGGRIALHFALRNPERIQRLILESASPGIKDETERERRRKSDDELAVRLESEGIERFVDEWVNQPIFASQKSLPAERQALGHWWKTQHSVNGLAGALRGFSVGRQAPLHDRLRELPMPVLILAGELDAKYRDIGEAMAHSIPRAQFRIIAGAGHAPHWEQPDATAAAVKQFLNSTA